jgi:hypothetical protein
MSPVSKVVVPSYTLKTPEDFTYFAVLAAVFSAPSDVLI